MSSKVPPVRNCWPPMAWRAPLIASGCRWRRARATASATSPTQRGSTTRLTGVWLSAEWVSFTHSVPGTLRTGRTTVCMGADAGSSAVPQAIPENWVLQSDTTGADASRRQLRHNPPHGRHQSNHPRAEARAAFARHHLRHARQAHRAQRTFGQANPVARLAVAATARAHLRNHRHLARRADPPGVVGAGGDLQHA